MHENEMYITSQDGTTPACFKCGYPYLDEVVHQSWVDPDGEGQHVRESITYECPRCGAVSEAIAV